MKHKKYPKQEEIKKLFKYKNGELCRIKHKNIKIQTRATPENKYRSITINKISYPAHRLIYIYHYGDIPKNMEIDHIDHNKSNNKIKNLRLVSPSGNQRNKSACRNSKSGVMGVRYDKISNKWRVVINIGGKQKYIGSYKNVKEAIAVRKHENIKYGYHKNHGMSKDEINDNTKYNKHIICKICPTIFYGNKYIYNIDGLLKNGFTKISKSKFYEVMKSNKCLCQVNVSRTLANHKLKYWKFGNNYKIIIQKKRIK